VRAAAEFLKPYTLRQHRTVAFFASTTEGEHSGSPGNNELRSLQSFLDAIFLACVGQPVRRTIDVGAC
jgi:hypothetical protein